MVLPAAETPAMDEVNKNTPPSRFALNVGSASRRRCKLALQFTAQALGLSQYRHASVGIHCYLVPIFFSHEIKIAKFRSFLPQFRKLCKPLQCIRRSMMESKLGRCAMKFSMHARLTAFDTTISSPFNPSIASLTTLSQSSRLAIFWRGHQIIRIKADRACGIHTP